MAGRTLVFIYLSICCLSNGALLRPLPLLVYISFFFFRFLSRTRPQFLFLFLFLFFSFSFRPVVVVEVEVGVGPRSDLVVCPLFFSLPVYLFIYLSIVLRPFNLCLDHGAKTGWGVNDNPSTQH